MNYDGWAAVLAGPVLSGGGLPWLVVIVVLAGIAVAVVAVRTARRPSSKRPPPMTRPRLLPRDHDDDQG